MNSNWNLNMMCRNMESCYTMRMSVNKINMSKSKMPA